MIRVTNIYDEKYKGSTGCFIDIDHDIGYLEKGEWHRIDGPSVEYASGYKAWWYYGERSESEEQFYDPEWRRKVEIKVFL